MLHDVCRDLTRAQRARTNTVFVLLDVELMRERDNRGFRGRIGWPDQIAYIPASQ